jgi:TrmH family RNA methyltransferase
MANRGLFLIKLGKIKMKIFRDIISSRNNPTVKWAASLADKKGRGEARSFIAEGEKLTIEALRRGLPVTHIFVMEGKEERIIDLLEPFKNEKSYADCQVMCLSESAFLKISTEKAPQGIITVIKYLDFFNYIDIIYKEEFFLHENEKAIILSSVRDPGNIGSVIRSAVAFGVDHIILSSDSADLYNPKTVRSAMGSLFRVKISIVSDLKNAVRRIVENGRRVYSAELSSNAKSLSEVGLKPSDVVIIGNEGHGIDAEISAVSTGSVYIPISKKTESLNASVAAAIFMWEISK